MCWPLACSLGWLVPMMLAIRPVRDKSRWRSPWGGSDERLKYRGAEPGNRAATHDAERRHRRGLAAGQRDQLAVSPDAGRAYAAADRRDARGPRVLHRRRVARRRAQAADPEPEHRDDGIR